MKRRVIVGSVVAMLACVAGYLGAHRIGEPGSPRWTEDDLSPTPPAESNGWVTVIEWRELERADWVIELPDEPEPDWDAWRQTIEDTADRLNAESDSPVLWRRVRDQPRFVDACELRFDADCHLGRVLDFWDQVTLLIIGDIRLGEWPQATPVLQWWERTVDYVSHPRGVVSAFVGQRLVDTVLPVMAMLMLIADDEAPTLRAIAEALDAFEFPDLQRALMADYIEKWKMFGVGETSWFYDRGHSLRLLGRDYETVLEYAASRGAGPRPSVRAHSDRTMWWIYNARGKELLDLLETAPSMLARIDSFENAVREIDVSKRRIAAGLRAAADRIEAARETTAASDADL